MLTALTSTPTLVLTHYGPPVFTASWIGARVRRSGPAQRIALSAGVWIVREQQWLPVSALDSATSVPEPDLPPSVHIGYSPPDWMLRGLCAQLPVAQSDSLFFGIEVREAPGVLIAAANKARVICGRCPVAVICLTDALINDERYGVWGGTSGRQREKLRLRLAAGAAVDDLVAQTLTRRVPA